MGVVIGRHRQILGWGTVTFITAVAAIRELLVDVLEEGVVRGREGVGVGGGGEA